MLSKSNIPNKEPEEISIEIDSWRDGTITNFSDTRRPNSSFGLMKNAMLFQDGIPGVRYGTSNYGKSLSGSLDGGGSFTRYNNDGTKTTVVVSCAGGNIYYSINDMDTWIPTMATYTAGKRTKMIEYNNVIYIYNGIDSLKLFKLSNFSIITYDQISAPVGVNGTRSGSLSAGAYNNYYTITATNDIGETTGSVEVPVTTNKYRESWTAGTDYIDIKWTAVSGNNIRYNIYYSDQSGKGTYLDSVTGTEYRDGSQSTPNPYVVLPLDNTTSAPKFSDAKISEGRMICLGNPSRPYRVYATGVGNYAGYFSPFYGGIYIDLDEGGPEIPTGSAHFRTGSGSSSATIFTSDAAGEGSTWHITLSSTTIGDIPVVVPQRTKVTGSAGTNAPDAIIEAKNSIIFPSTQDIFAIGSKPQMLNILSTDSISQSIRPNIRQINNSYSHKICGTYAYGNVYLSVPMNESTVNNQTWVLNTELGGWSLYWDIGFKYFFKHTDSGGKVHLIGAPTSGGQYVQISDSVSTDNGKAFESRISSGIMHFSKDHTQWIIGNTIIFEILNPRGTIHMLVSGTEFNKSLTGIASDMISDTVSLTGWGFDSWASVAWGDTNGEPVSYTQSSRKVEIKLKNKLLNNIAYEIYSTDPQQQYFLSRVTIKGYPVNVTSPSSWRN